jgi:hypothetical protein
MRVCGKHRSMGLYGILIISQLSIGHFSPFFLFSASNRGLLRCLRLISRERASLVNFFLRFIRNMRILMYELCISLFLTSYLKTLTKYKYIHTYMKIHTHTHTQTQTHPHMYVTSTRTCNTPCRWLNQSHRHTHTHKHPHTFFVSHRNNTGKYKKTSFFLPLRLPLCRFFRFLLAGIQ